MFSQRNGHLFRLIQVIHSSRFCYCIYSKILQKNRSSRIHQIRRQSVFTFFFYAENHVCLKPMALTGCITVVKFVYDRLKRKKFEDFFLTILTLNYRLLWIRHTILYSLKSTKGKSYQNFPGVKLHFLIRLPVCATRSFAFVILIRYYTNTYANTHTRVHLHTRVHGLHSFREWAL